jgi:hypothetical protein
MVELAISRSMRLVLPHPVGLEITDVKGVFKRKLYPSPDMLTFEIRMKVESGRLSFL